MDVAAHEHEHVVSGRDYELAIGGSGQGRNSARQYLDLELQDWPRRLRRLLAQATA